MKRRRATSLLVVVTALLGLAWRGEPTAEGGDGSAAQGVRIERVTAAGVRLDARGDLVLRPAAGWRLEFWMTPADCEPAGPDGTACWYQMEGLDADWSRAPTHVVQYTSLPPGSYVFRVRRCGPASDCGADTAVRIRLLPFWYQTLWFRLLTLVLAGAALMIFASGVLAAVAKWLRLVGSKRG
jgi:hypothetical protein